LSEHDVDGEELMSTGPVTEAARLEQLSALVDGEMDPAGAAAACAQWRDDVHVRASWHAYHLIGDVLRSDDLAIEPSRDAAFLAAVRERLSREAVVLAPVPAAARRAGERVPRPSGGRADGSGWRWPWVVSTAVAAGFVGVIGTLTVSRQAVPEPAQSSSLASVGSPTLVAATRADAGQAASAAPVAAAPARVLALDESGIVRDPTLDAYLAAHKQFAGSTALGVPSAFLRSATVRSSGR
jgi:sigma-E factor negative regulatory protein RseA